MRFLWLEGFQQRTLGTPALLALLALSISSHCYILDSTALAKAKLWSESAHATLSRLSTWKNVSAPHHRFCINLRLLAQSSPSSKDVNLHFSDESSLEMGLYHSLYNPIWKNEKNKYPCWRSEVNLGYYTSNQDSASEVCWQDSVIVLVVTGINASRITPDSRYDQRIQQ